MLTKGLISLAAKAASMGAILLSCASAALPQSGETRAFPAIEQVYLARDNGTGKPGDEVTEFATGDIPIHCVVMLDAAAKVTVKMNFVAVAVAGVKAETKVVTASYTTNEQQNRVNFTGRPDGKWTPGRYRVDIFLDGKPQTQLEFAIKGTPASVPVSTKFVQPASKPKPKTRN